jgi:hypothetical protein
MFKSLNELEREVGGEQRPLWKRTPLPLKFFTLFGFVRYTVPMYLTYSPPSPGTYPRPRSLANFVLAYSVCPVCILMPTVDPTPSTMAYFVGSYRRADTRRSRRYGRVFHQGFFLAWN